MGNAWPVFPHIAKESKSCEPSGRGGQCPPRESHKGQRKVGFSKPKARKAKTSRKGHISGGGGTSRPAENP